MNLFTGIMIPFIGTTMDVALDRMQSGKAKRNEMNVSWYENYLGTFYMCPAWQI